QCEQPLGDGPFGWGGDRVQEGLLGPAVLLVCRLGLGVGDLPAVGGRDQDLDTAVPGVGQLQCGDADVVAGDAVEVLDQATQVGVDQIDRQAQVDPAVLEVAVEPVAGSIIELGQIRAALAGPLPVEGLGAG